MNTRELTVSCSCGVAKHTFQVSSSSLPLPAHLCSCDISRRISGSLLTSYINITHPATSPSKPDTSRLTPYDSSGILRRWFCTTCGTHMYLEYHSDRHFEAATGTLQCEASDDIVEFKSCMWIGDTQDGGASKWVKVINGKQLEAWMENAGAQNKQKTLPSSSPHLVSKNAVHAHCHCKGVEFWISPPTPSSRLSRSPYPDLMIPHHLNKSANPDNMPWWLPGDGTRYLAGTCTCASCRRASGSDITFWAFVPTSNIFLDSVLSQPFPQDGKYWGAMRKYTSSIGVTRTFCSQCGANVFWHGDEGTFGRKDLVDVAVGLLDAPSGARAEEILAWWAGRVSFEENALHKGLASGLQGGLRE
ncbi:hypothetical protein CC86DRAFT_323020 [Ophiobolus disseminans]|uniref:CENP-V/GFA domain-containing protein n=1 Tax=Ophiobolus disseminans TaxID=1469910 RepID=A0A6A7A2X5_9PLEO|nr:hypothetical protein CC86DRAFT_323020 [Ophiobolus disseminans]